MDIEMITKHLHLDVYGFTSIATNKDYVGTAFKLSSKMWQVVKANGIKNKGTNIWVYETDHKVFAGVELENHADGNKFGLEKMTINLDKYAYFRHVGPYNLIKYAGQSMTHQLTEQGFEVMPPYIEIYGHSTSDETKSETVRNRVINVPEIVIL